MADVRIEERSIPELNGKIAVISGGASGIGHATATLLATRGATVHILDLTPPSVNTNSLIKFIPCDVTSWSHLRDTFGHFSRVDMVFANAGIAETEAFLDDTPTSDGLLAEPEYKILDVNLRSVLNIIKLSYRAMKRQDEGGSIVLTSSATAYAPESCVPVYSATKLALVGLVRSLRSSLMRNNVTINAVAPAATITSLLSPEFLKPILQAGLPTSTAAFVARAMVFSATAGEAQCVEPYGKDRSLAEHMMEPRWNGRVIMILGDRYTELEEPIANLRPAWFGTENTRLTWAHQAVTDSRP
ncbi:MAG: hypothetical protein Q9191_004702 [Dirinaria sp. TL-2023a]